MRLCAQEALALEDGEVETWVIRASGKKLLEARIDQLRNCVAVTRIPQRTFTSEQWRQLSAQLGAWKVSSHYPHWLLLMSSAAGDQLAAARLRGVLKKRLQRDR